MKRFWVIGAVLLVLAALGALLLLRPAPTHGPLVVVDAGHGGTFGNTGVDGVKEQDLNLAIAKRLRKKLLARGYRVIMTRATDAQVAQGIIPGWRYLGMRDRAWAYTVDKTLAKRPAALRSDLQARVDIANKAGADVFVSVHNNAAGDASMRGTESYAYRGDVPGKALAASVQDAVIARTGSLNRGSHATALYVCRWTNMPAVLVEGAYFTNADDAAALKSSSFQNRIADGIVDGLDRWFISYPLRESEPQLKADDSEGLACAISSAAYPGGSRVAVLLPATATALGPSAATLAAKLGGPLLLTSASGVSAQTAAELRRLAPARVVLVGVSSADLTAIGSAITKAAGSATRLDILAEKTAPAVAANTAGEIGVSTSGEVAIADAADAAALTALAPYAARERVPVLLSQEGRLADESSAFLAKNRSRIKRVLVVGCATQPAAPSGFPVTKLHYADPDELAARLLGRTDPASAKRTLSPVVVDAGTTPDVFTAAAEAARRDQPLLQLNAGILGPYSREFLANRSASVEGYFVLRDTGSISPVAESALRKSVGR